MEQEESVAPSWKEEQDIPFTTPTQFLGPEVAEENLTVN